jgi:glycosyltransferase involved in cell wall biosynthesis
VRRTVTTPRFSIVMPAYNAAATLDASIGSVLALDCDDWELVITDDGSTDDTRAICDRYAAADPRVTVATQPNGGAGAAIGAAIERARGDFIVQMGADDELLPEYCSVTSALIDAHPDHDIYASNAYRLFPDGRREIFHAAPRFERELELTVDDLLDEPCIFVTAAFRREWFERVGGFRPDHYNEDYDFWLRIVMAGARHIYTPVPTSLYRVMPGQKTEDAVRSRLDDIAILRDAVASGQLTAEQVAHAERTIALLERNVAFRRRIIALVGPKLARPVFSAAHKAAWLIRPHRRAK